jgi:adenine-specific DNA-methyltransferase
MYPGFSYIGAKGKLLIFLKNSIEHYTGKTLNDIDSFLDGFSGSGIVGYYMISNGINKIISNDIQHYSYIISSVLTKQNLDIQKLYILIDKLNNLNTNREINFDTNFIYNNYTPIENKCERMYLTNENGLKTDIIRQEIEKLYQKDKTINESEYHCLIKLLLYAVTKVSNTSSTYGAYLKNFKESAKKSLILDKTLIDKLNDKLNDNNCITKCYNKDIHDLLDTIETTEVSYFDPPYNGRQYSSNYSFLENISKYDSPKIKGKTGLREDTASTNSDFCSKVKVENEFSKLINKTKSKYIFISYSSESILSKDQIINLLKNRFTNIKCYEFIHKRFKSNNNGDNIPVVKEYLFCGTQTQIRV